MRKLKRMVVHSAQQLSDLEMSQIQGESGSDRQYHYTLRCDQNTTESISVNDCERSTVMAYCGSTINAVCIETYY